MTDIPELTDDEATVLRQIMLGSNSFAIAHESVAKRFLRHTDISVAALAAYDAKQRAKIEAPLRVLIQRLVDFCDRGPKDPFTNSALLDASEFLRKEPTNG